MANKNLRSALSLPHNEASKNTSGYRLSPTVTHETYIRNMSNYDRFEAIRRDMWEKHRWSIGTFLYQMGTEPRKLYDWSIKTATPQRHLSVIATPSLWPHSQMNRRPRRFKSLDKTTKDDIPLTIKYLR